MGQDEKSRFATNTANILLHISLLSIVAGKKMFDVYSEIAIYVYTILILLYYISIRRHQRTPTLLLMTAVSYMVVSVVITGGGLGSVLTCAMAMATLDMTANVAFSFRQSRELALVCYGVNLYVLIYSIKYASNWKYYMLNDINPNTLGMYLMFTLMLWDNLQYIKSKGIYVFLSGILLTSSLFGLINLHARAMMAVVLFYCILKFIPRQVLNKKRLLAVSVTIMLVCAMFPFVLLYLYKEGFDLQVMGKSLYTGREVLWSTMFRLLGQTKGAWLFGLGSKANFNTTHNLNVHNDYFATIVNFGLVGFVLNSLYILFYLNRAFNLIESNERSRKWLYMFLASILLLGATETVTHWAPIFILSYLSLGIASKCESEGAVK